MKTRYLILATLAMALLAVSCQKAAVGGAEESEEAPVPIQLTTNLKVNSVSVTKAGVDKWNAENLYIYAIKTPTPTPTTEDPDILLNNAKASAPSGESATTNPNDKKSIELKNSDGLFYYYPVNKSTYDFYGYYVGSADETPEPQPDDAGNIVLPITLDGSQDIMLAKADKEADVLAATELISPANAYSAYSARKGVVPNLVFQHQLSRFVFSVVAGNDDGLKVKIKSVTLKSNNQANLVVVAQNGERGISEPTGDGTFTLKDSNGNYVTSWFPKNVVADDTPYEFKSEDQVGESIMVIPAEKHYMVITMQQMNSTEENATELGNVFTYEYNLDTEMIDNPVQAQDNKFLPGYQYNVHAVVYGREQVDLFVTLTKWADGGTITIDKDKEWGDEPKLGLKATKDNADYYLYFYDELKVGTEVKVWDPATNEMVPAEAGIYKFETPQDDKEYVKLKEDGGKTVVEDLYDTNPDETPGTE